MEEMKLGAEELLHLRRSTSAPHQCGVTKEHIF